MQMYMQIKMQMQKQMPGLLGCTRSGYRNPLTSQKLAANVLAERKEKILLSSLGSCLSSPVCKSGSWISLYKKMISDFVHSPFPALVSKAHTEGILGKQVIQKS